MNKITTVLFDFDGTIMDTNSLIINSWQYTFRTIEGKERPEEEIIATLGEPLALSMKNLLPNVPVEQAVEIYRKYQHGNFSDEINIYPGMLELIKKLKKKGYKMGIVTSRMTGTTIQGLEKYGIRDCFEAVVTCDHTEKHKPDPEPVNIALKILGSKPEESIMIGDSKFDILCAKNAGVKSVLVGWAVAMSGEDREGEGAPEHIIENAEDLFQLIENDWSRLKTIGAD
ncbi:MAG: HAD-IIIA family hydrolase [Peptostreptococcaceae bacterium]|nr:HAD-IIIA family hydrolase [Peptostreptococcaceae bacterium]